MKRILLVSCLLAPSVFAIIDTNRNGLSDLWEETYNNGDLFPSTFDPEADPDHDGWTNAQEAAAATDPFDANSPAGHIQAEITHVPATYITPPNGGDPEIASPEAFQVAWPSLVGKQYTLEFSPDLGPGNWMPLGTPMAGTGSGIVIGIVPDQSAGTPEQLFWRVAVSDVDTDGDFLTNYEEATLGTSISSTDSDGDGVSDVNEAANHTDPNDPNDTPVEQFFWLRSQVYQSMSMDQDMFAGGYDQDSLNASTSCYSVREDLLPADTNETLIPVGPPPVPGMPTLAGYHMVWADPRMTYSVIPEAITYHDVQVSPSCWGASPYSMDVAYTQHSSVTDGEVVSGTPDPTGRKISSTYGRRTKMKLASNFIQDTDRTFHFLKIDSKETKQRLRDPAQETVLHTVPVEVVIQKGQNVSSFPTCNGTPVQVFQIALSDESEANAVSGPVEVTVKEKLLPMSIEDNIAATGVDNVSITAKPSDMGYQDKFWIMAPAGVVPPGAAGAGSPCENLTRFKIRMSPATDLQITGQYSTPTPSTVTLGGANDPTISWHGTGTDSHDDTPVFKMGPTATATTVNLPIGVKTMKNRMVKVAVHTVASVVPGKANNPPNLIPTETQIKTKLNEIFGLQINAYFDVTMLPPEAVAFDVASATTYVPGHTFKTGAHVPVPGNGTLDYVSWSSPEACLATANRTGNYNIHVYLLGGATPIICYRASFENPAELEVNEQALGLTNGFIGENYCIIDADRDAMTYDLDNNPTGYWLPAKDRTVDAVVETIAHEIGHIIVGDGHPDNGGGVAPLLGTDRTKRLMCSGPNSTDKSKLLVKKEWDKAEGWLNTYVDKQ